MLETTDPISINEDLQRDLIGACRASMCFNSSKVASLIDRAAQYINQEDFQGKRPIFHAIDAHNYEMVCALIDAGVSVDCEYHGRTPVQHAMYALYSYASLPRGRNEGILKIAYLLSERGRREFIESLVDGPLPEFSDEDFDLFTDDDFGGAPVFSIGSR